jgi:hypothetical protein
MNTIAESQDSNRISSDSTGTIYWKLGRVCTYEAIRQFEIIASSIFHILPPKRDMSDLVAWPIRNYIRHNNEYTNLPS